ncbi:hypothetical protein AGMMS50212_12590 [Spirochaetia bacterium]|nr:hypothetical protein AGMMS50212_12590 [Spirochaetia bacterium]
MNKADNVREYCIDNYINPARKRKEKGVFISSGDVHKALRLSKSYPAVCAALGSEMFETDANVQRVHICGPLNSASTTFVFIFR